MELKTMTKNETLQWQDFCKKYSINYAISQERKYANSAMNYASYVNSSSKFDEMTLEVHHRYELAIYEDALLALMKLDAEKTEEENLRKRNITVRAAWAQYQLTLHLCKGYDAQD